ncbi:MAG: ATP synthase subunit I [Proteobacteria bacterium]|nr:ATP synthase subunit I [Pseudomonadota bacterium]MBU1640132.1 ATP synthase subunit I [Pseudomonadota bacterium]
MTRKIDLDSAGISIAKIERFNWLFTGLMALAGWLFFSPLAAKSVLVGGIIANISFTLMRRDIVKTMQGALNSVKVVFLLKYYAKLPALALLLYFIIKHGQLAIGGLLVGLSSVVLSVGYTALCEFIRYYGSKKKNLDPEIADKGQGSFI